MTGKQQYLVPTLTSGTIGRFSNWNGFLFSGSGSVLAWQKGDKIQQNSSVQTLSVWDAGVNSTSTD